MFKDPRGRGGSGGGAIEIVAANDIVMGSNSVISCEGEAGANGYMSAGGGGSGGSILLAAGGSIHGNPDWWGKRRFAYPINKKEDGYYVVYNVEAPGGALNEVERTLRIADEVVRHKLMRLPDHEAARRGMMSASA